jgi:hypothetical protein
MSGKPHEKFAFGAGGGLGLLHFFLEGAHAELPQILLNFCVRPSSFGLRFPDIHVIDSLQFHVYKERSSIGSPIMTFIYGANTSNHPGYLNWSSLVS